MTYITEANVNNLKPGDVICDENGKRFLIIHINDEKRSIDCMDQTFGRVYLGMDWIYYYSYVETLDIKSIINWFCEEPEIPDLLKACYKSISDVQDLIKRMEVVEKVLNDKTIIFKEDL